MAVNPCFCGCSLQTGAKIVSILQIVGAVIIIVAAIFWTAGGAFILANSNQITNETFSSPEKHFGDDSLEFYQHYTVFLGAALLIMGIVALISGSFTLILGIILLKGAQSRNIHKCRIWLIIQSILVVISILSCSGGFLFTNGTGPYYIPIIILDLYFIWIVWAFIEELKVQGSEEGIVDETSPMVYNKS